MDDFRNEYNNLHEEKTEQDKENSLMKLKVEELTKKMDTQYMEMLTLTQNAERVENQENKYQSIINQQSAEIQQLKIQLEAKDSLSTLKESFEEKLQDLECRRSSKRKEEKLNEQRFNDDIKHEIK